MHLFDSPALAEVARRQSLLAFDFDGTLAPIVAEPAAARMADSTRRLLQQAAQRYPVAIVSGRAQADLARLLAGVTVWALVGNHGAEPSLAAAACEAQVGAWLPLLRPRLAAVPGVRIEDKQLTLALHYRGAPDEALARAAIAAAVEDLPAARVLAGKKVVNLIPAGAPDKGRAVLALQRRFGCDAALYAGDDETDEDVFALASPDLFTVRVGPAATTAARLHLRGQPEIDGLLQRLLDARPAPPGRRWEGRSRGKP